MLPVSYILRNLIKHKITTVLTTMGIGLVVFVFSGTLMLTNGLKETLVATGSDDNAICIRAASQTEVQSIIGYEQAQIVSTYPEIAADTDGAPLFTNEVYVLINVDNRTSGSEANVVVRGVTDKSFTLRPRVKLVAGRLWQDAGSEIIAGVSAAERFVGCGLGETVRFGAREWTVVGIFDSDGSGFDSELWGDLRQMADAFRRPIYSSLTFRLVDPSGLAAVKARVANDPRLPLEVKAEKEYYADQSEMFATFMNIVGLAISIVFSLGAIVGAMITMYAAVANRTKEIGTLRSLGFRRISILTAFLLEGLFLSLTGGIIGVAASYLLQMVEISTTNWGTFSEIAFRFAMSPTIAAAAILFSLVMGLVGGFLPAVRAARLNIVDSLRAA